MTKELIILIIVIAGVLHLFASGAMLVEMCKGCGFALSPVAIKEFLELTWFGTVVVFILGLIIFTWVYLICFLYFLFKGEWPEEFE